LAAGPEARIMAGKAPRIRDQLNREDDMRSTGHERLIAPTLPSPGVSAFTRVFDALCGGGKGRGDGRSIDRRGFLNSVTLAGAAALAPQVAHAQATGSEPPVRVAQAGAPAASSVSAITVKSVERLAGSAASYAYAVKAGPFIFLNDHEAYDFEKGLAGEVEGPPGFPLSGRPPLRREADYILRRMRAILKDFGSDLPQTVRVDQYYTKGAAVSAYHLEHVPFLRNRDML
jgi:hypothetical protein